MDVFAAAATPRILRPCDSQARDRGRHQPQKGRHFRGSNKELALSRSRTFTSISANLADRQRWAWCADWLAVAVAAALPWSTSGALILMAAWLVSCVGVRNFPAIRDEILTLAGGLPIALAVFGDAALLWADVPWSERIDGWSSLYKLVVVPILIAQFRRSERGTWVAIAFLASCTLLMVFSWALFLLPDLAWRGRDLTYPGIPVRDYIAQSNMFTLCVFGLIASAWVAWRKAEHRRALCLAVLALPFLANVFYVAPSRTALAIIPLLIVLFGWVWFGWRGFAGAVAAALVLAAAAWSASPVLRQRVVAAVENVRNYQPTGERSSTGERLEFWRKSLIFISEAPWIGHGTGSVRNQFRRAAVGQTGMAAEVAANPHNQIFAVAIQWGLAGTLLLVAMWIAHLMLFRAPGLTAWIGLMIVVQNIVGSLFNSHLFDFTQGWAYMWGVGVFGGMVLRGQHDLTRNRA
jgi:hypothetical protein